MNDSGHHEILLDLFTCFNGTTMFATHALGQVCLGSCRKYCRKPQGTPKLRQMLGHVWQTFVFGVPWVYFFIRWCRAWPTMIGNYSQVAEISTCSTGVHVPPACLRGSGRRRASGGLRLVLPASSLALPPATIHLMPARQTYPLRTADILDPLPFLLLMCQKARHFCC